MSAPSYRKRLHNPVERMNIILQLSTSGNETPFALLDELYRFILDCVADVEKVLDILAFILLHDYIAYVQRLNAAEELLDIEFRSTLVDMHSLLSVPPPSDTFAGLPKVYHASLEDFLMDRSRSRQYYIGEREGHLRISRRCLKAMEKLSPLQHVTLQDKLQTFCIHAMQSPDSEDLTNDLAHFDLRVALEKIIDFDSRLYALLNEFFDYTKILVGSDRLDIILRLKNVFDMFLLERIAQYPPSLRAHIPAFLCFSPSCYLFGTLLLAESHSTEEYTELLKLDKRLLDIKADCVRPRYSMFESLFQDKLRAGEYFVDGKSYAALASTIVSLLYSKPKWDHNYQFFSSIQHVLEKASTDWDLANFCASMQFSTEAMWSTLEYGENLRKQVYDISNGVGSHSWNTRTSQISTNARFAIAAKMLLS